jgi:hypothetical protein
MCPEVEGWDGNSRTLPADSVRSVSQSRCEVLLIFSLRGEVLRPLGSPLPVTQQMFPVFSV